MLKKIFQQTIKWVQRYPVIVATVAIFGYYMTVALDLFQKSGRTHLSFMDFVVQFDSLIWMWLAAFIFIKLQQTKEKVHGEEREKLMMQYQLEKSKIASSMLKDITKQLQDSINNPLAVISVTTEDIRKRFIADPEILRRLDQIDASMQRIHHAIKDIANYQSAKVLEELQADMSVK